MAYHLPYVRHQKQISNLLVVNCFQDIEIITSEMHAAFAENWLLIISLLCKIVVVLSVCE